METIRYPFVNEYHHDFGMNTVEDCKDEVMNFSQSIYHEENAIVHAFSRLPPLTHPIPPAPHFLADNYYNQMVKPNLILNQNLSGDEYQLPFQVNNYEAPWQPLNQPKQEPLDLRPLGENLPIAQNYNIQQQEFIQNRTHFTKLGKKNTKRENQKMNPRGMCYPIDDDTLLRISIPELNQQLKTTGTPPVEKDKLKKKRRQLKNRKYAESCRQRRKELIEQLQRENHQLRKQIRDVEKEIQRVRQLTEKYKEMYYSFLGKNADDESNASKVKAHTTNEYL